MGEKGQTHPVTSSPYQISPSQTSSSGPAYRAGDPLSLPHNSRRPPANPRPLVPSLQHSFEPNKVDRVTADELYPFLLEPEAANVQLAALAFECLRGTPSRGLDFEVLGGDGREKRQVNGDPRVERDSNSELVPWPGYTCSLRHDRCLRVPCRSCSTLG